MKSPKSPAGQLAIHLASRLRDAGHQAYLVGGSVRDLLLEQEPKDFDIATDATPAVLQKLFPSARQVGAHFGVILVMEEGVQVEVATFRSDHAYLDGRRPEGVDFETDPRRDVMRRDFTINALLLDPATGEVIDHVGGREDLERGLVRAVGEPEVRFQEDHLRMLRAVRFAARLGFRIEAETAGAIRRSRQLVQSVSAERVRDELIRILTEGGARPGFELLSETGLLDHVLPEVAAMQGVEQPPEFHPEGDVWTHTMMMLETMRDPKASLALGVLLHDVGKPPTFTVAERIRFDGHVQMGAEMAVGILRRLRCSNPLIERVEALVANHLRFMDVKRMKESTLRRFLRIDGFEEHLELHRLDCLASHGNLANYDFMRAKLEEFPDEQLRPPLLITGRDLIAEGYLPGPGFRVALDAVEDAQLEGRILTREEALALARPLLGPTPADR